MRLLIFFSFLLIYACGSPETPQAPISTSPPEWSYNQTIYEVNIRQFSEDGTFDAVREDLPRLKELGVGIIWLMPIHPIGEVNRKGTLGSYYSVKDYFDVNPEFGTKDDFRRLVEATHDQGMYLILDWVANHTAWDNPLTVSNPAFFETDENGDFIPPRGTDWDDVIQLDYENPEVWDYMISALKYWVEEFNIDGYRADVADLVPTAFWNRARKELDQIKPVFMLAEAETPEHHYAAFDMSYSWRMHHLFNAIAQGAEPLSKIDEYIAEDRSLFPPNAFRMQFTSNHDENSWNGTVFERLGDAVKTFAVLASTMDGMPLLYNGQEAGLNKRLEFFERDPIEWEHNEFFDFYSRLFNLNLHNEALFNGVRGGRMVRIPTSQDDLIYAFYREKNNDRVIVLLNLSNQTTEVSWNYEGLSGLYTDLFMEESLTLDATSSFNLEPWQYHVFVK
ncbi:MAG: alpha-amylase [Bacteroidetes bacterium]|nr:alpha-amylase [Bacteroidota bacterium]MCH8523606.1 alpha-amylase [Balneolales bacterium]